MLPTGAFAVAVLLGGVQIMLPAPAFVEQGRTWAPARAILQRAGHGVGWDPARRAMLVMLPHRTLTIPVSAALPDPATPHPPLLGRQLGGTVYLSLPALRQLGIRVQWDHARRRVELSAPPQPGEAGLAQILADPLAWLGHEVSLTGEYLGWSPDRFHFATRQGPPVGSGDWILHNHDGALYCSAAPTLPPAAPSASLTALVAPQRLRLTPYTTPGTRLNVRGVVKLSRRALPYLCYSDIQPVSGSQAVIGRLVAEKQSYLQGEQVFLLLTLRNPSGLRQSLNDLKVELVLRSPAGKITDISLDELSKATTTQGSAEVTTRITWPADCFRLPGVYAVSARVDEAFVTYPAHFELRSLE